MKTTRHLLTAALLGAISACATSSANEGSPPADTSGGVAEASTPIETGGGLATASDSGAPIDTKQQPWGSVIAVGPFASCVIDEQSAVHCFGRCGPSGQGGSRNMEPAGTKARSVAVGNTFACALLTEAVDGSVVRCWGGDAGSATPKLADAVDVVAGGNHACARAANGSVTCWGAAQADAGPSHDPPSGLVATALAASDAMDCALTGDGSIRCWGPRPAQPPPEWKAKRIAVSTQLADPAGGPHYGCAVTVDDSVHCWGDDVGGVQSVPAGLKAKEIAVGRSAACAIGTDGAVVCWGTPARYGAPAPQGRKATALSMSFRTVGAVLDDRSFAFWGDVGDGRGTTPAGVRAP